jgi:hypothetical protein
VSAPVRGGEDTIVFSLHRTCESLTRLRNRPDVALLFLAEDNVAFTVRGTALVIQEPMNNAPDYAAVAVTAAEIDDHRQPGFVVEAWMRSRTLSLARMRATWDFTVASETKISALLSPRARAHHTSVSRGDRAGRAAAD